MRKICTAILFLLAAVTLGSCSWKMQFNGDDDDSTRVDIQRYDRLEARYLTTGDFSALQQMNIDYPIQTRTLVEKMLQIGEVDDPEISSKFLRFYQDSALQSLIADAEAQYANMDDINAEFSGAFGKLTKLIPGFPVPMIYAQIGALDQSVVVGEKAIGISLDKYLGTNYPLYLKYYPASQRELMKRSYIVPDALCFYILSLYPIDDFEHQPQSVRDLHVGKAMWTVNHVLGRKAFRTPSVRDVSRYMRRHPKVSVGELLESKI